MFKSFFKIFNRLQRTYHVDFTKTKYNVKRGNYNHLEDRHIYFFMDTLGEDNLVMILSDLEKYNVDWFKQLRGSSRIVLKPKTTEQVTQVLNYCNNNKLAVCPQGGNTSVVGGSVPVFDEIIISMERMNNIESLDQHSGILKCQSGCILQNLDNYLKQFNLITPLDLGAKGSCHIGGNVSTNAGGLRLFKYGNLHNNILGLEIVKANGEILDCLNTLKKDNTGYHLHHLFIGSEGTLGIITKVAFQCPSKPKSLQVALLGCQNFNKVLQTFTQAQQHLNEILSAFEVIDSESVKLVEKYLNLSNIIGDYPFYILLETSGSNEEHDADKLDKFVKNCLLKHFILNGTATSEPLKFKKIWEIRERLPETFKHDGYVFMYDVSLPLNSYYELVEEMKSYLDVRAHRVFGFGHLGDGNLHLQISVNQFDLALQEYIETYLYKRIIELKGSISAEHGIGFLKVKYLPLIKSQNTIAIMKNLKKIMDPNGILNPYKIFI